MNTMMEQFQISLAAARVNAGLTQSDVASEMRVGKQTIGNWENGKSKPSFATLQALCILYGVPINRIRL